MPTESFDVLQLDPQTRVFVTHLQVAVATNEDITVPVQTLKTYMQEHGYPYHVIQHTLVFALAKAA
jgi:hypothetical protein